MNKKLNVVFIGSFLYPHGFAATKRKQQFLDYIIQQGDCARVILTFKRSKGHEINDIKGIHKGIPYEALGPNVKPDILFPVNFLVMILKTLISLLVYKKKENNIIVAFGINIDTLLPLFFAKMIGYKIIFDIVEDFSTIKNSKIFKEKLKLFFLRTFPKIFRKILASGVTVISKYLYEKHTDFKIENPLVLVPISAENLYFQFKKKAKKSYHLLYSGTYGDKEGLPTLIAAFVNFSRFTDKTKLILTGNCPVDIIELLKTKLGSLDRVELTGRLSDDAYYQALKDADILLMTRTNSAFANAGFPYKLGEYLATMNPVICTDTSDVSLYLKHMKSAMIVPPDNVESLYQAMCHLFENPDLSKRLGKNGWKVCHTYFNPEINSQKFYNLLQAA